MHIQKSILAISRLDISTHQMVLMFHGQHKIYFSVVASTTSIQSLCGLDSTATHVELTQLNKSRHISNYFAWAQCRQHNMTCMRQTPESTNIKEAF